MKNKEFKKPEKELLDIADFIEDSGKTSGVIVTVLKKKDKVRAVDDILIFYGNQKYRANLKAKIKELPVGESIELESLPWDIFGNNAYELVGAA